MEVHAIFDGFVFLGFFFFFLVVVVAGQCCYMQVIRLPYQYPNLTQNQRLTERERKKERETFSIANFYCPLQYNMVKQSVAKYSKV